GPRPGRPAARTSPRGPDRGRPGVVRLGRRPEPDRRGGHGYRPRRQTGRRAGARHRGSVRSHRHVARTGAGGRPGVGRGARGPGRRGDGSGPPRHARRGLGEVGGAVGPMLVGGGTAVVEGFGFGAAREAGGVTFAGAGGGTIPADVVGAGGWSDLAVRVTVPDGAVAGPLTLTTPAGLHLTATVHVIPRVSFVTDTLRRQPRAAFPSAPVGVGAAAAEIAAGDVVATTL